MKLTKIINRTIVFGVLFYMIWSVNPAMGQTPIRDPHTPGYVSATELPDGANPSPYSNGNFIIGPTHDPARESTAQANVPQGTIYRFAIDSKNSKI
ncbi:MAG: esterase [Mucilaginibacter sp.]|nr:esterase [Mucilaginibacter sp.]